MAKQGEPKRRLRAAEAAGALLLLAALLWANLTGVPGAASDEPAAPDSPTTTAQPASSGDADAGANGASPASGGSASEGAASSGSDGASTSTSASGAARTEAADLAFRTERLRDRHFEKHGRDMGFPTAQEYERAAGNVVANPDALHKIEAEDGDDVYYLEDSDEFVVVSTDGYIRTYFQPGGKSYFDRQ